jgi:hypothetical protein
MAGPVDFRSTTYFVDQEGAPTLVAVKRQSDTRLRREVVGEMLDYAANAVVYWPVEQLRSEFEANCPDPAEEIRSRLHVEDAETLWQRLKTNLQAGRIRMLFVADQIPAELRRIVEFLNQQMDPAEMLALGLRRFAGEGGLKIIVPGAYGETEEAKGRKGIGPSIKGTIAAWKAHQNDLGAQAGNRSRGRETAD